MDPQERHRQRQRDPLRVGGVLVTIVLHGGIAALILIGHAHRAESVAIPRDFMVAKIVRLGRKRPKNLLPTLPAQPAPTAPKPALKLADDPSAKPAPPSEKPPPNTKQDDSLQKALSHARQLERAQKEVDQEGDPAGDPHGNSDTASPGDIYATAVFKAYNEVWRIPETAKGKQLTVRARIFIDGSGNVLKATPLGGSGDGPFDDSVSEVLARVRKLPAPPAKLALAFERSGLVLEFAP
jgi:TonB family protein